MSTLVRLDKIGKDTHLITGVYTKDIENGRIVKRGALRSDGDSYDVSLPADLAADDLYFISSSILMYDERKSETEFINKAGKALRGYKLRESEIVTITNDGFDGTSAVGKFLIPQVGKDKMKVVDTYTTEGVVFEVIALENYHGIAATVLQVKSFK